MGKFTQPEKKVKKTQSTGFKSSSHSSVPSASELANAMVPKHVGKSEVGDKNVHAYVMPFCSEGGIYGAQFQGPMDAVHTVAGGKPNVLYKLLDAMAAFASQKHDEDESFPASMQAMQEEYNFKVQITGSQDPDNIGTFEKGRVAFYVDRASVKNFLCLLDSFIAWRVDFKFAADDLSFVDGAPKFIMHVASNSLLFFESSDEMECEFEVVKGVFQSTVHVFQASPPSFPSRFVVATVEGESKHLLSVVFSGNLYPFKLGFDAEKVAVQKLEQSGQAYPEWYRVIRMINLQEPEKKQWLLDLFGEKVLKHSPCVVHVRKVGESDEVVADLVKELSELQNIRVRQ